MKAPKQVRFKPGEWYPIKTAPKTREYCLYSKIVDGTRWVVVGTRSFTGANTFSASRRLKNGVWHGSPLAHTPTHWSPLSQRLFAV